MKYLDLDQLSSLIYRKRRRQKVSQEQLASKMRIRRETYGGKENEPGKLTVYELNRLAVQLGTSAAELLQECTKEI